MPHGATIVYLPKKDSEDRERQAVSLLDLLCQMVEDEPAVHNAFAFYHAFFDCMEFRVEDGGAEKHKLTEDVNILRNFCKQAVVYYYTLGFIAFRLVPNAQDKRVFEPYCIPIRQISFSMTTEDIWSIHKTPAVSYREAHGMFGHMEKGGEDRPQILVYKFPPALLDAFSLGPLSSLVSMYVEVLKVREHNTIVLSEHANTVSYIESNTERQDQLTANTVTDASMQSFEEIEHRKKIDVTSSERDFEYTREVLERQVDMTEASSVRFLEQRRQQFIILPKDTRVSTGHGVRSSFVSVQDNNRMLQNAITKMFAIPDRTSSSTARSQQTGDSGFKEPMGVRLQRKAMEQFFTVLASVLSDASLLDKLTNIKSSRKKPIPPVRRGTIQQTDEGIPILHLYTGPKVKVQVVVNSEEANTLALATGLWQSQKESSYFPADRKRRRSRSPRPHRDAEFSPRRRRRRRSESPI